MEITLQRTFINNACSIIAASLFLALCSQLSFPLPFTPVPLTLQTLALFIIGTMLGSKRASLAVLLYLLQGTLGLPVFASPKVNPLWIITPQAGFLLSFVPAVFIIGTMTEKRLSRSFFYLLFTFGIAQGIIFTIGTFWLSYFCGFTKAIKFGVIPFLSGAFVKIIFSAFILRKRSCD